MRIGMLTPSSNTVVEPVTMRLAAAHTDRLTVHFSRFPVTVISDEPRSHHQFDPAPMLAAARLLADAHVDVIVWNGTSGAWEGIEHDRELASRIQVECDIPATRRHWPCWSYVGSWTCAVTAWWCHTSTPSPTASR